jgi:hypothetical protein
MAKQRGSTQDFRPAAAGVLFGLGLVIFSGALDGPAGEWSNWLGAGAGYGLGLWHCVAPLAWRALQTLVFEHRPLVSCSLEGLLSLGPMLLAVVGVI